MPLDEIQRKFEHLQRLTRTLVAIGAAGLLAFALFAIYEVHQLRSTTTRLGDLNDSLCDTLGRAGIILEGSKENPCERLPRSPSSRP